MNRKEELELNYRKSEHRIITNLTLLGISFTLFSLIATISPGLFDNYLLSLELIVSIPLFMSSIFARSKMAYSINAKKWDFFGFLTFILAYTFLINSIGMILSNFVPKTLILIFFVTNIIMAISYSAIQVSYDKNTLKRRIYEDFSFILLIVILGLLPVLGLY